MQNGWQQPANQSAYNQVHRTPPSGVPSYEMLNQQNIPPSYSQPMPPQPTPIPTEFLPSFVDQMVHIYRMLARSLSLLQILHCNQLSRKKFHL